MSRLAFREFADGTVCFDPLTGETRLVPMLGAHLLQVAQQDGCVSAESVLADLGEPEDDEPQRRALVLHLHEVAAKLIDAGLLLP